MMSACRKELNISIPSLIILLLKHRGKVLKHLLKHLNLSLEKTNEKGFFYASSKDKSIELTVYAHPHIFKLLLGYNTLIEVHKSTHFEEVIKSILSLPRASMVNIFLSMDMSNLIEKLARESFSIEWYGIPINEEAYMRLKEFIKKEKSTFILSLTKSFRKKGVHYAVYEVPIHKDTIPYITIAFYNKKPCTILEVDPNWTIKICKFLKTRLNVTSKPYVLMCNEKTCKTFPLDFTFTAYVHDELYGEE